MKRLDLVGRMFVGHLIFMVIAAIIAIPTLNTEEGRSQMLTTQLGFASEAALNPEDYEEIKNTRTDNTLFDAITKALNVDLWVSKVGNIINVTSGVFISPYVILVNYISTQTNSFVQMSLWLFAIALSYLYYVYPVAKLIFGEARVG